MAIYEVNYSSSDTGWRRLIVETHEGVNGALDHVCAVEGWSDWPLPSIVTHVPTVYDIPWQHERERLGVVS